MVITKPSTLLVEASGSFLTAKALMDIKDSYPTNEHGFIDRVIMLYPDMDADTLGQLLKLYHQRSTMYCIELTLSLPLLNRSPDECLTLDVSALARKIEKSLLRTLRTKLGGK